jgi:hypothetical protein
MLDRDIAELLVGAGAILIFEIAIFQQCGGCHFSGGRRSTYLILPLSVVLPPTRRRCHDMAEAAEQLLAATNWLPRKIRRKQ